MPEQVPKTPRQLGEEAQALYGEHKKLQGSIEAFARKIDTKAAEAKNRHQYFLRYSSRGNHVEAESYREERDSKLQAMGHAVLEQADSEQQSLYNNFDAKNHYHEHQEGYHDLAITEASLDGVKINVQQLEFPAEKIEVHTISES